MARHAGSCGGSAEWTSHENSQKKSGNSAVLRIPASVMAAAGLSLDQIVDVSEDRGRLIIAPIGTTYDLDQLISRMDPETFPEDADFGPPIGREAP